MNAWTGVCLQSASISEGDPAESSKELPGMLDKFLDAAETFDSIYKKVSGLSD